MTSTIHYEAEPNRRTAGGRGARLLHDWTLIPRRQASRNYVELLRLAWRCQHDAAVHDAGTVWRWLRPWPDLLVASMTNGRPDAAGCQRRAFEVAALRTAHAFGLPVVVTVPDNLAPVLPGRPTAGGEA